MGESPRGSAEWVAEQAGEPERPRECAPATQKLAGRAKPPVESKSPRVQGTQPSASELAEPASPAPWVCMCFVTGIALYG